MRTGLWGEAPDRWRVARLRSLIDEAVNGSWGAEPGTGEPARCVRATDFDRVHLRVRATGGVERSYTSAELAKNQLRPGDILLEKSGGGEQQPVGKGALFDLPGIWICSNFMARLRPSVGVESAYLCFLLEALYIAQVNTRYIKQTTGIQNLDTFGYLNETVRVPPIEEQRAIVRFLDEETAKLDRLTEMKRRLVERLPQLVQARLSELLRGRHSQRSLRQCVERFIDYRGATPQKSIQGVPLITAANIKAGTLNFDHEQQFVTEDVYDEWMRRGLPRVGDVLITTEAPLGEVAQVEAIPIALAQRLILLPAKRGIDPSFLALYLMSSKCQGEIRRRATGSTALGIKASHLKSVPIAVPPEARQREIVAEIRAITEKTVRLRNQTQRAITSLVHYRSALITAAVTGQIDVRADRFVQPASAVSVVEEPGGGAV